MTKNYPSPKVNRLKLRKHNFGPKKLMTSQGHISGILFQKWVSTAHMEVGSQVKIHNQNSLYELSENQWSVVLIFLFLCVCRVCETGSDHQPLSDNQQTNCEYFVDSLFEEAQKVGAKSLSPTEQKKQVSVNKIFFLPVFLKIWTFRSSLVGQQVKDLALSLLWLWLQLWHAFSPWPRNFDML